MRKWQMTIALTVVVIAIGGYVYFTRTPVATVVPVNPDRKIQSPKDDGNSEASDVIEPLVVMGRPEVEVRGEFGAELEVLPRVILVPGVQQPPRPDVEPGKVLRMPYADEEEGLGLTRSVTQMIERDLPRLDIFDYLDKTGSTEESEPRDVNQMQAIPVPDYHHQHCPAHSGCPAPYRPVPRN